MNLERLLVSIDLSERSEPLCLYAAAWAEALGARPTFLHVDEFAGVGFRDVEDLARYLDHVGTSRNAEATALAKRLEEAGVDDPDIVIIPGRRPEEAVAAYADEHDFDAIVVARRSRKALIERLIGSTTYRLVRDAERPILVVPEDTEAWMDGAIGPVLAPTDLEAPSARGVVAAKALAERMSADLLAVYVVDWPGFADLAAAPDESVAPRIVRRVKKVAAEHLARHLADTDVTEAQQRVLTGPSPAEALSKLAADVDASMLVVPMSARGAVSRFFLGSTATRLLKVSPVPTLMLPQPWLEARG